MTSTCIDRAPQALEELLIAQISAAQGRVYHLGSGKAQSSMLPRITIETMSPRERPWFGERWGTNKRGVYKDFTALLIVWDKNPKICEQLGAKIEGTIWRNRGYHPADETNGYFVNMFLAGGTPTRIEPALQLYRRTVRVKATWLDINAY